jgi:uncharacterized phiE125 gp8 family phage protein
MSLTLITGPALEPITLAELRRHLQLNDTAGEPAPTAPAVALPSTPVAGDCDAGAWRIGFTFVTADGETELGPLSDAVTVADPAVNGQISVTAIAIGGSGVTSRKAYALAPGETVAKYAATLANNTATTSTINVAASALGVEAPSVNTTLDPELTGIITAVRERCEMATRRALLTQTWDLVLDTWPGETWIELPLPPLQSVTSVKYRDTGGTLQAWAATNYVVEAPAGSRAQPGRVSLAYAVTWPSLYGQAGDVTVRFVCGYGAAASSVPAILKRAMLVDAGAHYAHREEIITGTIVNPLPLVKRTYWSYQARLAQRRAA